MNIIRNLGIIAVAVILAFLFLKIAGFVIGLFMSIVWIAILAAAVYVVFVLSKSALRRRFSTRQ